MQRIGQILPYAVLLVVAAWFYQRADYIQFNAHGDSLGPDFWPRVALAAIIVLSAFQIGRTLLRGPREDAPAADEADEGEPDAPRSAVLLAGGVILTVAYGALIPIVGFLIATFGFMVLFMYAGTYRSHLVIWLSSLVGAVGLLLIFQKVVYVSLPRGVPPFDGVADWLLAFF